MCVPWLGVQDLAKVLAAFRSLGAAAAEVRARGFGDSHSVAAAAAVDATGSSSSSSNDALTYTPAQLRLVGNAAAVCAFASGVIVNVLWLHGSVGAAVLLAPLLLLWQSAPPHRKTQTVRGSRRHMDHLR